jgi:hypothetical protein
LTSFGSSSHAVLPTGTSSPFGLTVPPSHRSALQDVFYLLFAAIPLNPNGCNQARRIAGWTLCQHMRWTLGHLLTYSACFIVLQMTVNRPDGSIVLRMLPLWTRSAAPRSVSMCIRTTTRAHLHVRHQLLGFRIDRYHLCRVLDPRDDEAQRTEEEVQHWRRFVNRLLGHFDQIGLRCQTCVLDTDKNDRWQISACRVAWLT